MAKELSKLFGNLDAAVGVVQEKRSALDAAIASQQAARAAAETVTQVAQHEYDIAVAKAQDLRAAVRAALDESLPSEPTGVVVNR